MKPSGWAKAYHTPARRLGVHDRVELERAGREHHAEQAEAERDLVGHELGAATAGRRGSRTCCCSPSRRGARRRRRCSRGRTPRARPRRGPGATSSGSSPVQAEGGDRRQRAAEGDRGEDRQRRGEDHQRRGRVEHLVDVPRREVFLEDDLQAVGERLAEPEEPHLRERDADAVGALAVLHPGGHPALDEHEVGRRRHQAADEQADLHEGDDRGERGEVVRSWWVSGELMDAEVDAGGGNVAGERRERGRRFGDLAAGPRPDRRGRGGRACSRTAGPRARRPPVAGSPAGSSGRGGPTFTQVPARSAKPAAGSRQVASCASGESKRSCTTRLREARQTSAAVASSIHGPGDSPP